MLAEVLAKLKRAFSEPVDKGYDAPITTKGGPFENLTGGDLSNPFSFPRIIGNVAGEVTAKQYGYTPLMRSIMMQSEPALVPANRLADRAAATYHPARDEVSFLDPRPLTLHHETTHAAWNRMSPKEKKEFLALAQRYSTPASRQYVGGALNYGGSLYGGGLPQDLTQANPTIANEMHSFFAESPEFMSPQMRNHYSKYFTNFNPTW